MPKRPSKEVRQNFLKQFFQQNRPVIADETDPDWLELRSAGINSFAPNQGKEMKPRLNTEKWTPRNWLEKLVGAPVIPYSSVLTLLGEDQTYNLHNGPRQSLRERNERSRMGTQQHKLFVLAIRGEIHEGRHSFTNGRLTDRGLQDAAGISNNLGIDVGHGAQLDSEIELQRVFRARDQFWQAFGKVPIEDEVTGLFPWIVGGRKVYLSGRVDVMCHKGTGDAKFGENELPEHGAMLTLLRDIMVFSLKSHRWSRFGDANSKFLITETSLEKFQPEIRNGSDHLLFYPDKTVSFRDVRYTRDKVKTYHNLICEAVASIADEMAESEEFESYFA